MKCVVVVPTYWGPPHGAPGRPGDAAYDHPTPIDGDSTLPRLLDSLAQQPQTDFTTLILTATVSDDVAPAALERVQSIIRPNAERLRVAQIDEGIVALARETCARSGLNPESISLRTYANVRNLQLLIPYALEADAVIALDDDEVVPTDYVEKAQAFIGRDNVVGVAGLYLDAQGSPYLRESDHGGNLLLEKSGLMNRAIRQTTSGPDRLNVTPLALGGNMVFHRELFARIPFDPGITRGEDIDYLLNARLAGYKFWMDRELTITHLPPRHYESSAYRKMREDVFRFVYEREKLRQAGVSAQEFDPYPGLLLRDDLDQVAIAALQSVATPDQVALHGKPEEIVEQAQARTRPAMEAYASFREHWPALLSAARQSASELRAALGLLA